MDFKLRQHDNVLFHLSRYRIIKVLTAEQNYLIAEQKLLNPINNGGGGGVFTSRPVNCSELQNEQAISLKLW